MTFLDEALLGFMALAAIPIIIHLLNRRNFKIVDWAAIRFLLESMQKNSRRLQLRDLILLLLRTLAILLVVLAIARPLLSAGSLLPGGGGANAVILLDNSMSMNVRHGATTRFAAAQGQAEHLVSNLPRGSRVAVITFNSTHRTIAQPTSDLMFARDAIRRAKPTDGGTDLLGALTKAENVLQRMHGAGVIYIISDMQRNAFPLPHSAAWPQWTSLLARLHARHDQVVAMKIGRHVPAIVSIQHLKLVDPLVHAGTLASVVVTVVNHGPVPAQDVGLSLYSASGSGKLVKVAATVIPRVVQQTQVTLSARLSGARTNRLVARLSPQALPPAAVRRLATPVVKHLRVLLVDGGNPNPQGADQGVDGALFLRTAIAPRAAPVRAGGQTPGSGLFGVRTIRIGQIGRVSIGHYQAIILSNVAEVQARWAVALHRFVQQGGAMLIFAGPHVQPENYRTVLLAKAGLLPAALTKITLLQAAGRAGLNLQVTDLSNPIFSFFKSQANRTFLLQPVFTKAFGTLEPGKPADGGAASPGGSQAAKKPAAGLVIARFSNGMPAVVTRSVGHGMVVLFTTSAGKQWSNFPLTPAFVMLVRRTLLYAVLNGRPQLNGTVGTPLGVPVPTRLSTVQFIERGPGGETHAVSPTVLANGRTTVALAHVRLAGFYSLAHGPLAYHFAVNPPAGAANLQAFSKSQVRAAFPGVKVTVVSGRSAGVLSGAAGMPLWPVFLGLAVACLLAESSLALYWAPEEHA